MRIYGGEKLDSQGNRLTVTIYAMFTNEHFSHWDFLSPLLNRACIINGSLQLQYSVHWLDHVITMSTKSKISWVLCCGHLRFYPPLVELVKSWYLTTNCLTMWFSIQLSSCDNSSAAGFWIQALYMRANSSLDRWSHQNVMFQLVLQFEGFSLLCHGLYVGKRFKFQIRV